MHKNVIVTFFLLVMGAATLGGVEIVCTIHPYALLTQDIVQEMAKVTVLIPAGRNPHNYSLNISDVKKLAAADLVVANGLYLESHLHDFLNEAEKRGKPVFWVSHAIPENILRESNYACTQACGLHHGHSSFNPHLWLHPQWVTEYIIPALTGQITALIPYEKERLAHNARMVQAEIRRLEKEVRKHFSLFEGKSVVINHPSFYYFFRLYGIEEIPLFSGVEIQPSVNTLKSVVQKAAEGEITALFYEKQFDARKLELLARETGLPLKELDPLGSSSSSFTGLYEQNIQVMREVFYD